MKTGRKWWLSGSACGTPTFRSVTAGVVDFIPHSNISSVSTHDPTHSCVYIKQSLLLLMAIHTYIHRLLDSDN